MAETTTDLHGDASFHQARRRFDPNPTFRKVVVRRQSGRTGIAVRTTARDRARQDRAEGDDRAQAAQRLRKREFDMRRNPPRRGRPGAAAPRSGSSASTIEARRPRSRPPDGGVKAKIDEIEQQMVGRGNARLRAPPAEFFNAPAVDAAPASAPRRWTRPDPSRANCRAAPPLDGRRPPLPRSRFRRRRRRWALTVAAGPVPGAATPFDPAAFGSAGFAVEVSEVARPGTSTRR